LTKEELKIARDAMWATLEHQLQKFEVPFKRDD